jgi:signal-transduction protein with cAMP-binding, CBS, and nucleotidyltransferase domain
LCRNGVMAGNPSHCLSLDDWSDTFISQLMQSDDTAGHIGLYLDLRPVWGNTALGLELASRLRQRRRPSGIAGPQPQCPPLSGTAGLEWALADR